MKRIRKWSWVALLVGLVGVVYAQEAPKKHLNIIFIGNSITHGAGLAKPSHEAPPAQAVFYLNQQAGIGQVKFSNQGVSGCTTVDYLPETHTLFDQAKQAADLLADEDWATLLFSIMLGTNDSAMEGTNGAPVSPEQYTRNMTQLIDSLLALYPTCKVVVHRPIWYSPNTYNGAKYLQEGLNRLESYYPEIQALIKTYARKAPGRVFLGDTEAFDFSRRTKPSSNTSKAVPASSFCIPTKRVPKTWGNSGEKQSITH